MSHINVNPPGPEDRDHARHPWEQVANNTAYAEGALLVADGAGRPEPGSAVRTGEEATSP